MREDYYRKRAWQRLAVAAAVIVAAGAATLYLASRGSFQKIASLETSAQRIADEELGKDFSAPAPLVATSTPSGSKDALTRGGDIVDTNAERALIGKLPPLKENTMLDDIASLRLEDMFSKQYFAHVSPVSSSAETVAKIVGYEYLSLGENLALGNFKGDQDVVMAWMASPGHRANILNTHYTQIGVAAREGIFEGKTVWIAVQVFGRPKSDCPSPDSGLQSEIDTEQNQAAQMQVDLQNKKAQMDPTDQQSVNSYNALVDQYNTLVAWMKSEIAQYNGQVTAYNQCLEK